LAEDGREQQLEPQPSHKVKGGWRVTQIQDGSHTDCSYQGQPHFFAKNRGLFSVRPWGGDSRDFFSP
jgi:hypothetical protein